MATPTEPILVIATSELGGDGFTNKEAPEAPVTNEGYGKQSFSYQQANYLWHWQANWLKYINEEQIPLVEQGLQDQVDTINTTTIPNVEQVLQDQIDTINNTTIPFETSERESADITLQNNLNSESSTRSNADTNLQNQIDDIELNHGIGYSQTWQDVSTLRAQGVTYTNNTGKPIVVNILHNQGSNIVATITNGISSYETGSAGTNTAVTVSDTLTVVAGDTYSITGASNLTGWWELR